MTEACKHEGWWDDSAVIDSRVTREPGNPRCRTPAMGRRRRRICQKCGAKFSTYEISEGDIQQMMTGSDLHEQIATALKDRLKAEWSEWLDRVLAVDDPPGVSGPWSEEEVLRS